MDIVSYLRARAKQRRRTIVLPETGDARVLKAAQVILEQKLAKLILLGDEAGVRGSARAAGVNIAEAAVVDPLRDELGKNFAAEFYELRKHKGITPEQAAAQMKNFLYFAAMMVRRGFADGFVAGAANTTADVAKAAIYGIGFGDKATTVSSCFLVAVPDCAYGEEGIFVFADCGIVPDPSPAQLANIAVSAAELFFLLVERTPRAALLSFSTKGSARHEFVDKVVKAKEIINRKYPELIADAELQLDAAIVPEVAAVKAPQSAVAGAANVLIFPNLDAGNIGYKLVQRLAKAQVIGPMFTGLKKPCSDLSRGCSMDEVIDAVCTTAIRVTE